MKKRIIGLITLMLFVVTLVGCGTTQTNQSETSNTIKIGGTFPLTGPGSTLGIPASNGVQLLIDEYNAKGGILNKKIEFIKYDDKGSRDEAAGAAQKLLEEEKVDALVGSIFSSVALAFGPYTVEKNVPFISPGASNEKVTKVGPNIFRAIFIDPYQATILGSFAKNELKANTAAVLFNGADEYCLGLAEAFKKSFEENGGKIVSYLSYKGGDKDFKILLNDIKAKNPDIILVPENTAETVVNILKQAKQVGIKAKFLGGDGWDAVARLVAPLDLKFEAYYTSAFSPEDTSPEAQAFIKAYKQKYNETPNAFAALGYDAAKIMLEAIKAAGSTDKAAIIDAMSKIELTGATGKIKFDSNRNPIRSVTIIKIQDGKESFFKRID